MCIQYHVHTISWHLEITPNVTNFSWCCSVTNQLCKQQETPWANENWPENNCWLGSNLMRQEHMFHRERSVRYKPRQQRIIPFPDDAHHFFTFPVPEHHMKYWGFRWESRTLMLTRCEHKKVVGDKLSTTCGIAAKLAQWATPSCSRP